MLCPHQTGRTGVPLTGALPLPVGEEAAVPDCGGTCAGVHGSLDHKHLSLC